ncbi:MAG: hypothetical protein GWN21_19985, partial [Gammaproteobacteria bacterium]|nr:hypothetical protein [Gammaproteobacteria bacterium]NIR92019.1 hypothetical protein [Gammaproteobacteria bacterium]NIT62859.1 hypothetical protein [Gammaproteobacteria bacterium]NIV50922.1 hypothetical protein [Gammaproteobacteria bacterium]NIW57429.1 hypothetical protein [Gammaproteobacteria bacterium]
MKNGKIVSLAGAVLLAWTGAVHAALIDVVEAPTDYFVPDNSQLYNSPYYRWWDEDWGWQHGAVAGLISSATLNISAWDVDADYAADPEVDNIYVMDSGRELDPCGKSGRPQRRLGVYDLQSGNRVLRRYRGRPSGMDRYRLDPYLRQVGR